MERTCRTFDPTAQAERCRSPGTVRGNAAPVRDAEEARIIADNVMDAALCGYEYSGLPKILNVVEHKRLRQAHA